MRLQTSHMSPTIDLDSISCLMIDPMMISRSFVQIITYLITKVSSNFMIGMISLKIAPMTRNRKGLKIPKVEELKTLIDGEVPPIRPV